MKEQKFSVKLNISGMSSERAAHILGQNKLSKDWAIEERRDIHIALVEDHFEMFWQRYGVNDPNSKEIIKNITSHSLSIAAVFTNMDDFYSALNVIDTLRKNGAVCTRSYLVAHIVQENCSRTMIRTVKEKLANTPLLQTMVIFEPLQTKFSTYYHADNADGMEKINQLVKQLVGENLDLILDGIQINNNTPLSSLDCSREVINSIWY